MRHFTVCAIAVFLIVTPVFGVGAAILVKDLPDKGTVALSGIIDQVTGRREFILRDASGTIPVAITSNQSVVLKPGAKITVVGVVSTGFLGLAGKNVDATDVKVQEDIGSTLSDTVAAVTGLSVDQAKQARISELPKQGMVRLLGTVDDVADAKSFVLKDDSGIVDVRIQSDETIALKQGSEVIVIGYVDSSLFGKTIRATRVIVSDNANPSIGGG